MNFLAHLNSQPGYFYDDNTEKALLIDFRTNYKS